MKKFRLRHKYLNYFDYNNCNYLNYDIKKEIFYLESVEDTENYQTIFTDEEIKNIKLPEPLTLDMFDKIEVK